MDKRNWKFSRFGGLLLFLLHRSLILCWSLNDEGMCVSMYKWVSVCSFGKWRKLKLVKFGGGGVFLGLALLKFKERIGSDPYGALKNWKDEDGVVDPCTWFGVGCSDGKVVILYVFLYLCTIIFTLNCIFLFCCCKNLRR